VKTLPGADIYSDHNLLVAEVQTRLKAIKNWEEETKMEFRMTHDQSKPSDRSDGGNIHCNRWNNKQHIR
jgi:hypothetical protein